MILRGLIPCLIGLALALPLLLSELADGGSGPDQGSARSEPQELWKIKDRRRALLVAAARREGYDRRHDYQEQSEDVLALLYLKETLYPRLERLEVSMQEVDAALTESTAAAGDEGARQAARAAVRKALLERKRERVIGAYFAALGG